MKDPGVLYTVFLLFLFFRGRERNKCAEWLSILLIFIVIFIFVVFKMNIKKEIRVDNKVQKGINTT